MGDAYWRGLIHVRTSGGSGVRQRTLRFVNSPFDEYLAPPAGDSSYEKWMERLTRLLNKLVNAPLYQTDEYTASVYTSTAGKLDDSHPLAQVQESKQAVESDIRGRNEELGRMQKEIAIKEDQLHAQAVEKEKFKQQADELRATQELQSQHYLALPTWSFYL